MARIDLKSPLPTEAGMCRTCGATLIGQFCNTCGEKEYKAGEHTVRHFFGDVLNAITFLDGKFIRSIRMMISHPGLLSFHYNNGRRVPYMKPISMFFWVNFIYFLFPISDGLNSKLYSQMHGMPYSSIAAKMVEARIAKEDTDLATFTNRYDAKSTNIAKMGLVVIVFYFSFALWAMNYKSRFYYFDHLIASFELWTLTILYISIVLIWGLYLVGMVVPSLNFLLGDRYISSIAAVVTLGLLYAFERNTYSQSVGRSIRKAALGFLFYVVALEMYRATLFFVTMWTL